MGLGSGIANFDSINVNNVTITRHTDLVLRFIIDDQVMLPPLGR
jgi:hypothetical protein